MVSFNPWLSFEVQLELRDFSGLLANRGGHARWFLHWSLWSAGNFAAKKENSETCPQVSCEEIATTTPIVTATAPIIPLSKVLGWSLVLNLTNLVNPRGDWSNFFTHRPQTPKKVAYKGLISLLYYSVEPMKPTRVIHTASGLVINWLVPE